MVNGDAFRDYQHSGDNDSHETPDFALPNASAHNVYYVKYNIETLQVSIPSVISSLVHKNASLHAHHPRRAILAPASSICARNATMHGVKLAEKRSQLLAKA